VKINQAAGERLYDRLSLTLLFICFASGRLAERIPFANDRVNLINCYHRRPDQTHNPSDTTDDLDRLFLDRYESKRANLCGLKINALKPSMSNTGTLQIF
jgi:hypothetical protein